MGEAAKLLLCVGLQLWKLAEVSHEMFVLMLPRVSSRVSGFPVASPCLWGKLQNISFLEVSKQVVMSFCVAGVALCDIPTCFVPCRKCQNWRTSRMKCSFCCSHMSRPESLVFLWPRRVYGGSCKTSPFRRFSSRLSCRFAWQAWHFVKFQPVLYPPHSKLYTPNSPLYTPHFTLYTPHSTLYTPHSALHTSHFTLYTPHSTLHTPHFTLHTPYFIVRTSQPEVLSEYHAGKPEESRECGMEIA